MSNHDNQFSEKNFTWRDGRHWFDVGINLFKQVKNYWYLNCLLLGVLISLFSNLALSLVPLVVIFASPLITAYIMNACDQTSNNQVLTFTSVWQRVISNISALMMLGVISAVFSVLSHYLHIQLLQMFSLPAELTQEMAENMTGREAIVRGLLNLLTSLPIALTLAFSPALVLFKNLQPIAAVKYSVLGVIKSWKAFLTLTLLFMLVFFGVIILASFMVAIVMSVMGPASQVLINLIILFFAITVAGVGLCAQYQAYQEIFQQDNQADESNTEFYTEF